MPSSEENVPAGKLPKTFRAFVGRFPAIGEAHEKVAHLGINTRGFPATVAAWQWAWDQIQRDRGEGTA
jgi:hypothetical protein